MGGRGLNLPLWLFLAGSCSFNPIPQSVQSPRVLTLTRVVSFSTCICLLTPKFPIRPGLPRAPTTRASPASPPCPPKPKPRIASRGSRAPRRLSPGFYLLRAAAHPATAPHCLSLEMGPFRDCRIRPSPTKGPRRLRADRMGQPSRGAPRGRPRLSSAPPGNTSGGLRCGASYRESQPGAEGQLEPVGHRLGPKLEPRTHPAQVTVPLVAATAARG